MKKQYTLFTTSALMIGSIYGMQDLNFKRAMAKIMPSMESLEGIEEAERKKAITRDLIQLSTRLDKTDNKLLLHKQSALLEALCRGAIADNINIEKKNETIALTFPSYIAFQIRHTFACDIAFFVVRDALHAANKTKALKSMRALIEYIRSSEGELTVDRLLSEGLYERDIARIQAYRFKLMVKGSFVDSPVTKQRRSNFKRSLHDAVFPSIYIKWLDAAAQASYVPLAQLIKACVACRALPIKTGFQLFHKVDRSLRSNPPLLVRESK